MNKADFIQAHLIAKGVPADLATPNFNVLSRLIYRQDKPLVFQSPITLLIKHSLVNGSIYGVLMWLMIWHATPEKWPVYLISSVVFGLIIGGILPLRIVKAQKKLGNVSWEQWCRENYEPTDRPQEDKH